MALFDRLVGIAEGWLDHLEGGNILPGEGLKIFALLAPTLEALAILRGKIIDQRGAEAQDVTDKMRQNLEPYPERERISETLEAMRERFSDKLPKAN